MGECACVPALRGEAEGRDGSGKSPAPNYYPYNQVALRREYGEARWPDQGADLHLNLAPVLQGHRGGNKEKGSGVLGRICVFNYRPYNQVT